MNVYQGLKGYPVVGRYGKLRNVRMSLKNEKYRKYTCLNRMNKLIVSLIKLSGCQIYGFNSSVAALAEIWSLAAVSYDRSRAIYHPLDNEKRITKKQVSMTKVFEIV